MVLIYILLSGLAGTQRLIWTIHGMIQIKRFNKDEKGDATTSYPAKDARVKRPRHAEVIMISPVVSFCPCECGVRWCLSEQRRMGGGGGGGERGHARAREIGEMASHGQEPARGGTLTCAGSLKYIVSMLVDT